VRAFLSYSHSNEVEAKRLFERLDRESELSVTWDAIDLPPYTSPNSFMDSVREHDAVVHLISLPFLESRNCMRELVAFMKDDTDRNHYSERAVPIIIDDPTNKINLFDITGQLQLVDYWMGEKSKLEDELNSRSKEFGAAIDELRSELTVRRDIAEHVVRFVRTVTDNIYAATYHSQESKDFVDVVERLRRIGAETASRTAASDGEGLSGSVTTARRLTQRLRRPMRGDPELPRALSDAAVDYEAASEPPPEVKKLIHLRDSIIIPSHSDPERPEFPPFSPRFPATPTREIWVSQLGREITVKDESRNFTGSHKDRMAWEIIVYYKSLIQDLLAPHSKSLALPAASIISNGSAAMAIQVMLRCYGLPSLKVLVDEKTDERIVQRLLAVGCEVFDHDLSDRELDSGDVLELTENASGFDVTARNLVDPTRRTYYDWLAYEIFNCGVKHIFIPVGTGDLFVNILTVLRDELMGVANDRRLAGGIEMIKSLELYGATSDDWKTKMDKLYATHRPTLAEARRVVTEVREAGHCGPNTDVYHVNETIVAAALSVAKTNGVQCDESGIAGLSLLLQKADDLSIPSNEKILVVNTGWMALP
jgi:threonine dehydratase